MSAHSDGPGRGSRFVVKLPLLQVAAAAAGVPAAAAEAAPSAASTQPASRVILLADDNRDAIEVLAELLQLDGHTVHVAPDGLQAVEMAARLTPAVMVLDIGMPGLNGYEAARQIRALPAGGRAFLVAATGWGQPDDRQRALDAGFDAHLTKPFDPEALSALIAAHPD